MIRSKWYFNPVFIFIFSLVALGTSLVMYIQSYLSAKAAFQTFLETRNLDAQQFMDTQTWVTILILSILVAIIVIGLAIIFIYYQRLIGLYRLQQNFINGFTHELKTPLASLKLFLDTFSRHELSREEQLKYLDYMKWDTERLGQNVNEILNLARMEEKRYRPAFVYQDLVYFFESWLEKHHDLKSKCEVKIEKPSDSDFRVPFEPQLMEMLFMNMITNAINHCGVDYPILTVTFKEKQHSFIIQFSDNGIGIPKAEQKKIFKKFYQVGKSSKGSGLGLYLVQHIARVHKGTVKVYSPEEGQGTTFIIELSKDTHGII